MINFSKQIFNLKIKMLFHVQIVNKCMQMASYGLCSSYYALLPARSFDLDFSIHFLHYFNDSGQP